LLRRLKLRSLSLEACFTFPSDNDQSLSALAQASGYSVDYLGWLIRQGRLEAVKRRESWYITLAALQSYQAEVLSGTIPHGRPKIKE
jgi:hypothetical protein